MENGNGKEITEWVTQQLASLHSANDYEPNPAAALQRFHARKKPIASERQWPTWATWMAAVVLAIVVVVVFPPGRAAAQQLWQFLTVRQIAIVRVGSWPEDVPSPQVKLIGVMIPPIPSRNLSEAQWRVNYQPRLPRSGVLSASPRLSTTFSVAAGTTVNVPDLQLALQRVGIKDQTIPPQWQGAQLALHTSAMVIAEWPDIMLAQSLPLTRTVPAGFNFSAFSTLVLRILGVEPAEAERLARQMGTAPPWLAPLDSQDFDKQATIEQVALTSGPATLVQENGDDGRMKRISIFWSVPDRVYLLSGKLSRELTILTANAIQ